MIKNNEKVHKWNFSQRIINLQTVQQFLCLLFFQESKFFITKKIQLLFNSKMLLFDFSTVLLELSLSFLLHLVLH